MRRKEYPWFLACDAAGDLFAAGGRSFIVGPAGNEAQEMIVMKLGQNEPRLAVCTGLIDGQFHGSFVRARWAAGTTSITPRNSVNGQR